ncbi:hypothetical protein [uncultured Clostridium sp.]|uniref:hypothetical protein n=1 Tax=uncultured Clostridium sp. TaxID=59620 RepID=UPI00262DAAD8|nr:hypothetical protein [uncultured Clostridium sp.]
MERSERFKEIEDLIRVAVNDNILNKKLIKATRDEFIKKGFNINIPNLIWSGAIEPDQLNKFELMAISKSILNKLEDDRFKLKNHFTVGEIEDYNNLINNEKTLDSIFLKNVTQIDEKNYHCIITAEELYNIKINGLVGYYRKYQRAGIEYKTSSGRVIEKIGINKAGVLDMENRFLEKLKDKSERERPDIKPTSIAFTVLLDELTDLQNFIFDKVYENIGNLYIKPDYDVENETGIKITCSDGMHRYIAITNAFEKAKDEGKYLNEKLGLYIHLMTPREAIQYLYDVFQRNDTDLEYLKSIETSEDTDFINKFEKDSKWLNNHIATTKKELRLDKNFIDQKTLIDAFKNTDIPMKNDTNTVVIRERIAKTIDDILDYALLEVYNGDEKNFKNSIYFNVNMFILYVKFASRVRKIKYASFIADLVIWIENNKEELELKFNSNKIDIYNYLDAVINEVIK